MLLYRIEVQTFGWYFSWNVLIFLCPFFAFNLIGLSKFTRHLSMCILWRKCGVVYWSTDNWGKYFFVNGKEVDKRSMLTSKLWWGFSKRVVNNFWVSLIVYCFMTDHISNMGIFRKQKIIFRKKCKVSRKIVFCHLLNTINNFIMTKMNA